MSAVEYFRLSPQNEHTPSVIDACLQVCLRSLAGWQRHVHGPAGGAWTHTCRNTASQPQQLTASPLRRYASAPLSAPAQAAPPGSVNLGFAVATQVPART